MTSVAERRRSARVHASPNFRDGRFQNPVPTRLLAGAGYLSVLRRQLFGTERRVPPGPLPVRFLSAGDFASPPSPGVRVIWLGHSTLLIEIEGTRILTDPVFSERASPTQLVGPRRFHPVPIALDRLPRLDAVLVSHDHYDHLDRGTIEALASLEAPFVTSLGVGEFLERWGIGPDRIIELDWHESAAVGPLRMSATPARHFSGRSLFGRFKTLWSSWVLAGARHRVFFTGDTGFFGGLADIGRDHGPFDLALIKIGAYSDYWPDIHLKPEDAVRVHQLVRAERMLPIHWATFNLAFHAWDEPIERLLVAAREAGVDLITPRIGQPVDAMAPAAYDPWWREVG
jgi:L-ascorbate metabolism protein UlaG (beta-lactamase superfamily)